MRIGIDIREFEIGMGRYLKHFLAFVSKHDLENEYILFGNQRTNYFPQAKNQKVIVISEFITVFWEQVILSRALKREKVDIFLSPYFKVPFLSSAKTVIVINDLISLKVAEYQSVRYCLRRFYFKHMLSFTANKADKILAISHATKRDVLDCYKLAEDKIEVIQLALEEKYRLLGSAASEDVTGYGITQDFIFYFGNFKPHKNVPILLEAYKKLSPSLRNSYQLVLGGKKDRYYNSLRERVETLGIEEQVVFTDYIPEEKLPAFYKRAALFVFPSLYEGFGFSVLEAMAGGVPVITSNLGSLSEVGKEGALLIDPLKADDLSQAMEKVLTNKTLQRNLREKGLKRAESFTIENMSKGILSILNKVHNQFL